MWRESGNFMYDRNDGRYRIMCTVVARGPDAGSPCWEVRTEAGDVVEQVLIRPAGTMESIRDTLMNKYGDDA